MKDLNTTVELQHGLLAEAVNEVCRYAHDELGCLSDPVAETEDMGEAAAIYHHGLSHLAGVSLIIRLHTYPAPLADPQRLCAFPDMEIRHRVMRNPGPRLAWAGALAKAIAEEAYEQEDGSDWTRWTRAMKAALKAASEAAKPLVDELRKRDIEELRAQGIEIEEEDEGHD